MSLWYLVGILASTAWLVVFTYASGLSKYNIQTKIKSGDKRRSRVAKTVDKAYRTAILLGMGVEVLLLLKVFGLIP